MRFFFNYILLMTNLSSSPSDENNFTKIKNEFFSQFLEDTTGQQKLINLIDACLSDKDFFSFNNQSIFSEFILYFSLYFLVFKIYTNKALMIKSLKILLKNSNCFPCLRFMIVEDYSNIKYNTIIEINDNLKLSYYEIIRIYQYNLFYLMEINSLYIRYKKVIQFLRKEEDKVKNNENLNSFIKDILGCEDFTDKQNQYEKIKEELKEESDKEKLDKFYKLHINNIKFNNIFNYNLKAIVDSLGLDQYYSGSVDLNNEKKEELVKIISGNKRNYLKYLESCMELDLFEKNEFLKSFFNTKFEEYKEFLKENPEFEKFKDEKFNIEILTKLQNINMYSKCSYSDLQDKGREIFLLHKNFDKLASFFIFPNNHTIFEKILRIESLENEDLLSNINSLPLEIIKFLMQNLAISFCFNIPCKHYKCFTFGASIIYNQDVDEFDLLQNDICYKLDLAGYVSFKHKYLEYIYINNIYCNLIFLDLDKAHYILDHFFSFLIGFQLAEIKIFSLTMNINLCWKFSYISDYVDGVKSQRNKQNKLIINISN